MKNAAGHTKSNDSKQNRHYYKYVFLDLDHTLWDFHTNSRLTLQDIYASRNLHYFFDSFEQYYSIYDKRNTELWALYGKGEISKENLSLERFLHPLVQVGVHNPELALEIGREYLEILPSQTKLIPDALEILNYLHANYQLTLVSNGFVEVQYRKLNSAKIAKFFTHIVLSEEAKALKPDKLIFEYSLKLNHARASETIMIGDSFEADIIGAHNAGIDQIFFNPEEVAAPPNHQATFTIKHLKEILTIL